jgi:hypothetical protein
VTANTKQQAEFERLDRILKQVADGAQTQEQQSRVLAYREQMEDEKCALDSIRAHKARTGSLFLSMMLGHVNLRLWKKGEVLAFKEEYNKFKRQTAVIFVLFPLVQLLVFPGVRILATLHQLWTLFYYTALATRENILQVNGSDIQDWWILHHYLSMLVAVVTLLWPSGASYDLFIQQFLVFLALQGVIMILQNNYQNARHYVRRSLGKASDLDVAASETIQEKPTNLRVLVPALALTYVTEIYLGSAAMWHAIGQRATFATTGELWPLLLLGVLFVLLGAGNAITTFRVLYRKQKQRKLEALVLKRRSSISGSSSGDTGGSSD